MAVPGLVSSSAGVVAVGWSAASAVDERTLASPKSRILACPRLVTKTFAGLMSRWMMPLAWVVSSASASWMPRSRSSSIGSGFPVMCALSVWPSSNAMAMKGWPSPSPTS